MGAEISVRREQFVMQTIGRGGNRQWAEKDKYIQHISFDWDGRRLLRPLISKKLTFNVYFFI
jgi:hypothetical protein